MLEFQKIDIYVHIVYFLYPLLLTIGFSVVYSWLECTAHREHSTLRPITGLLFFPYLTISAIIFHAEACALQNHYAIEFHVFIITSRAFKQADVHV